MTASHVSLDEVSSGRRKEKIRIVSRAVHVSQVEKLKRAGADSVVSPNFIGGLRMVSEMIRPTVVTFLDRMLRDRDRNLRVEEIRIVESSGCVGKALKEIDLRSIANVNLLAVQHANGVDWEYNPDPSHVLLAGETLIVVGNPDDRVKLENALNRK